MADILPPAPIGSPFTSYQWAEWYKDVRNFINAGATTPWTSITSKPTTVVGFGITDGVYVDSSNITWTQSTTNGAGASAGTLNNAPHVGNPNKWIQVDDNGVIRAIPAWNV